MSIDKAILERLKEIAKTRESVEKQIELLNSLKGRDWRELVQVDGSQNDVRGLIFNAAREIEALESTLEKQEMFLGQLHQEQDQIKKATQK